MKLSKMIRKTIAMRMAEAKVNKTQDATAMLLVLRFHYALERFPAEIMPELFGRKDSWISEYRKGLALAKEMENNGFRLTYDHATRPDSAYMMALRESALNGSVPPSEYNTRTPEWDD